MADRLVSAKELAAKRKPRFANESAAYAKSREALLAEEIEVRRHLGRLARQNRELPEGPEMPDGAFGVERGWRDLPYYQAVGDDFSVAIGGLDPEKRGETPVLMVLRKIDGKARLHWMGEMTMAMADPGEDPRGAVDLAPLWNVLDLTPAGRDANWYPRLSYGGP